MAEGIDHSTHLKSLADQQLALSKEIETKRNLLMKVTGCLLYTSPSPRDRTRSRMPSSA